MMDCPRLPGVSHALFSADAPEQEKIAASGKGVFVKGPGFWFVKYTWQGSNLQPSVP
jgi:hypothetical protein